jgi:hypothetical protein
LKSPSDILLLGHAGSRRARLLQQACATRELAVDVLDWNDFIAAPQRLAQRVQESPPRWLKIDSPGEDSACALALRHIGWQRNGAHGAPPAALLHGEQAAQSLWYAGFEAMLDQIDAALRDAAARPRLLNSTAGIRGMMDKFQCQHVMSRHARVPQQLGLVHSLQQFEAERPARDWPRVFIKPRYGSSAAGVIALQRLRDGRLSAMSPARVAVDGRLFNHLRPRRYTGRSEITALVDAVAAQGAYAEAWVSKPRAPAPHLGHYDLRVIAHAGRAHQRIARIAQVPMTNLHLGNARAAPDWLDEPAQHALEIQIAAAAAAFPACHSIGFDLICGNRGITLLEANAFGDLLPGLHHAGRETYDDQAELMRRDGH